MRNTTPISVTLPHDMAAMVKKKVASGEYASESEVIRDGLRTLQARDAAMEAWLRDEVVKSYHEVRVDPNNVVTADHILDRIRETRKARSGK